MCVGVGVMRGGVNVTAMPRPILVTTIRLMIQNMIRVRRSFERRTMPPVSDFIWHFIIAHQWGDTSMRVDFFKNLQKASSPS